VVTRRLFGRRRPEPEPPNPAPRSNAYDLWVQADGDRDEYRRLLREAGLIVERTEPSCTDPQHGTCGYFCPTCGNPAAEL
jgi:hypothetical protein